MHTPVSLKHTRALIGLIGVSECYENTTVGGIKKPQYVQKQIEIFKSQFL